MSVIKFHYFPVTQDDIFFYIFKSTEFMFHLFPSTGLDIFLPVKALRVLYVSLHSYCYSSLFLY